MGSLDDLPKRGSSHELDDAGQRAFEENLEEDLFVVQHRDRRDYGTDYQLEVLNDRQVTNVRIHAQLKGTDSAAMSWGAIRVTVDRTNLNYLLAQPGSVYVCFHRPTARLLARYATDVFQEYERRGCDWQDQETITVSFTEPFSESFQRRLRDSALAGGRAARDDRLDWITTPPERLSDSIRRSVPRIEVPSDAGAAIEVLQALYGDGQDAVISKAFEGFAAVLGTASLALMPAYLAEINLGINGHDIDEERVRAGIRRLQEMQSSAEYDRGSLLYSEGNGWLALEELEEAREAYLAALSELSDSQLVAVEAQCSKNLGSVVDKLGGQEAAQALYERALELDPDLPQAHFALGVTLVRRGDQLEVALDHLDAAATSQRGAKVPGGAVAGWKVDALFRLGRAAEAFGLVNVLLSRAHASPWIWPWLAKQVAVHGRSSRDSAKKAVAFWQAYLAEHPDHIAGRRELLLCHFALRMADANQIDYESFRELADAIVEGVPDSAFVWDRVGHWAQKDGNWSSAEEAFRVAWQMEPSRYGYCLGTALNFLERFPEALAILQTEAEEYQADAMRWFQVGVANDGLRRWSTAIDAFKRATELDETYALAWFNLGGAHWNAGDVLSAFSAWEAAVSKFPDHELASRVRDDFLGWDPRDLPEDEW